MAKHADIEPAVYMLQLRLRMADGGANVGTYNIRRLVAIR